MVGLTGDVACVGHGVKECELSLRLLFCVADELVVTAFIGIDYLIREISQ